MKWNTQGHKIYDGGLVHETTLRGGLRCSRTVLWSPALNVDDSEPTTCLECLVRTPPQFCEMMHAHHPDCACGICLRNEDEVCRKPVVGAITESGVAVCARCAREMEREGWDVVYEPR